MIWVYFTILAVFMFAIGWFVRGMENATLIDHLEADLAAARRAARQRDMDLRTPVPNRPITKGSTL